MPLIAIGIGTLTLLGAAVGAYAYDASKSDEIAEGVTVGTVDVGGMTEAEAERVLNDQLVEPLDHPVIVKFKGDRFKLYRNDLDVHADIEGMVAEASAASRDGMLPVRVWRYATGGEVEAQIEPRVAYDEIAVDHFVEGVAAKVNREPINASVEPTTNSLAAVQGQKGITVDEEDLRAQIEAVLDETDPSLRTVRPTVTKQRPQVSRRDLADEYPTYITIDRDNFTLRLFKDLKLEKEYTIAIGAVGFDTPAGTYHISDKSVDPAWYVPDAEWAGDLAGTVVPSGSPENPLVNRWMGFYDGAGIHGTNEIDSLGTAASHGCIRMHPDQVVKLYEKVAVGTPLYIQ